MASPVVCKSLREDQKECKKQKKWCYWRGGYELDPSKGYACITKKQKIKAAKPAKKKAKRNTSTKKQSTRRQSSSRSPRNSIDLRKSQRRAEQKEAEREARFAALVGKTAGAAAAAALTAQQVGGWSPSAPVFYPTKLIPPATIASPNIPQVIGETDSPSFAAPPVLRLLAPSAPPESPPPYSPRAQDYSPRFIPPTNPEQQRRWIAELAGRLRRSTGEGAVDSSAANQSWTAQNSRMLRDSRLWQSGQVQDEEARNLLAQWVDQEYTGRRLRELGPSEHLVRLAQSLERLAPTVGPVVEEQGPFIVTKASPASDWDLIEINDSPKQLGGGQGRDLRSQASWWDAWIGG